MKANTKDIQSGMTPSDARLKLEEGNQRFCASKGAERDLMGQMTDTKGGQWPFAAIVGCIDSRVSPELVFDQGIGDVFSARIAGNIVNDDILGSLEFACKVAGSKLIVVLGHERCGAVMGACDDVKLGQLTGLLGKIKPAIEATTSPADAAERTAANRDFVHNVAVQNVHLTTAKILADSEVLREMDAAGEIEVVGAMYDVETGKVTFV
jgi:carbonic anhydrase